MAIEIRVGLGGVVDNAGDALYDVGNVGEITFHFAEIEDVDRFTFKNRLGEDEQGHIGPAPGAIDGEEPQAGGWETEKLAVAVGHQFIGLFTGGVETDGVIDVMGCGKRHRFVEAVDAGAGGVGEVLDVIVAAGFEDIAEADDVGVDIGLRIDETVADTGLGGEVTDAIELFGLEELVEAFFVFQLEVDEPVVRVFFAGEHLVVPGLDVVDAGIGEAAVLDANVIVVVNTVQADNFIAAFEEFDCQVIADKAGGSGD